MALTPVHLTCFRPMRAFRALAAPGTTGPSGLPSRFSERGGGGFASPVIRRRGSAERNPDTTELLRRLFADSLARSKLMGVVRRGRRDSAVNRKVAKRPIRRVRLLHSRTRWHGPRPEKIARFEGAACRDSWTLAVYFFGNVARELGVLDRDLRAGTQGRVRERPGNLSKGEQADKRRQQQSALAKCLRSFEHSCSLRPTR
jgi:hypothetical protein